MDLGSKFKTVKFKKQQHITFWLLIKSEKQNPVLEFGSHRKEIIKARGWLGAKAEAAEAGRAGLQCLLGERWQEMKPVS